MIPFSFSKIYEDNFNSGNYTEVLIVNPNINVVHRFSNELNYSAVVTHFGSLNMAMNITNYNGYISFGTEEYEYTNSYLNVSDINFNDSISNFNINFDIETNYQNHYTLYLEITFLNQSDNIKKISFPLVENTFNLNNPQCNLNKTEGYYLSLTRHNTTITIQELQQNCNTTDNKPFSISDIKKINGVNIRSYAYGYAASIIQYTNLYYLKISTDVNSLPVFDVSFNNNQSACLYLNESNKEFPLSWAITDIENEKIYYGYSFGVNNYTTFDEYYKTKCILGFCYPYPNENTRLKFLIDSDKCNITGMNYDITQHNQILIKDLTNYDTVALAINGNCISSDKGVYYKFPVSFNVLALDMDILKLDIDKSFNVSLQNDNLLLSLFDLSFYRNLSGIYIYNNKTFIGNFTNKDIYNGGSIINGFKLFISNTQNNTQFYIKITSSDNGISLDKYDYFYFNISDSKLIDLYRYLKMNTELNNVIYNTYLSYTLVFFNVLFNDIQLNNITIPFSNYQKHYYFYVTDEYHKNNNEYVKKDLWISATKCKISPSGINPDLNESKQTIGNLMFQSGGLLRVLCGASDSIINFLGLNINTCDILYIAYLVITIILSIILMGILVLNSGSPYLSFGIVGIVFSLSQFFTKLLFNYSNTFAIIWGFIFAVSFISLIIGLFVQKV